MTYNIPHGVYLKLEKISGLYIKRAKISGRDIFHFKSDLREYCLVDNGYNSISKTTWRFLSYFNNSFNFGPEFLPIKVTITDRVYTFVNSKGGNYIFIPEGGKIFLEALEAYCGVGIPNIIIEDKRKEILQKLIEHKEKIIGLRKLEIEQMQKEIEMRKDECNELRDKVYYTTKGDFYFSPD